MYKRQPLVVFTPKSLLRAFEGVPLNTRSHGEGFLAFLVSRVTGRGLWILDD